MPELPDVELYLEAIRDRCLGHRLEKIRIASPFLLRSVEPPISDALGRELTGVRRLGKRIVFELADELFVVLHLMIAGRLRWADESGAKLPGRIGLAAFDFDHGTLILTEAGSKRRASLHMVADEGGLAEHDRGGLEVLEASEDEFAAVLRSESHTLKRSLTDQRLFSGIGNAYSDEILFDAKLSPLRLSRKLSDEEVRRLFDSTKKVLEEWTERIRAETKGDFPKKVTAFRPEMAVHGKFREPCPVCQTAVQRIAYAENEVNYCPKCQNEGRLLKDRSLSRLLKDDWPRRIEELEEAQPNLAKPRAPRKRRS